MKHPDRIVIAALLIVFFPLACVWTDARYFYGWLIVLFGVYFILRRLLAAEQK